MVTFTCWTIYLLGVIRASRILHQVLIKSILAATLRFVGDHSWHVNVAHIETRWLDTTPISRVLTRCSQYISAIDERISGLFLQTSMFIGRVIVQAGTVIIVAGWQMIIPALVTIVFGISFGHIYIVAQLPVKRLMSNAKAPIIGHIQNALAGIGL